MKSLNKTECNSKEKHKNNRNINSFIRGGLRLCAFSVVVIVAAAAAFSMWSNSDNLVCALLPLLLLLLLPGLCVFVCIICGYVHET